jgi:hypothetical protein
MPLRPSYLGLLNAIAVGEKRAAEYLTAWIATTSDNAVRSTLHTICLREAEHAVAFEKRIDELGYSVIDRVDPLHGERMRIAAADDIGDREKFEQLRLQRPPQPGTADVFDNMFADKDIDIQTGALLGRYIAEERDTLRRFAACYESLPVTQ